jgi:hypothetical protein
MPWYTDDVSDEAYGRWLRVIKIEKKDRNAVKITISEKERSDSLPATTRVAERAMEKDGKSFTFHGNSIIRMSATPLKPR